jgi:hypothetical protein
VASNRKRTSQNEMQTQLDAWRAKAMRRGKMLKLCRTFLATIMSASNDSVRRSGVPRSTEAEAMYVLGQELTKSISDEVKNDERESSKWRPDRGRRASSGEAASSRRDSSACTGRGYAQYDAFPK